MVSIIAGAFLAVGGQMPAVVVDKTGNTTKVRFENGLVARSTTAAVVNPRLVSVPGSNVHIAKWTERAGGKSTPYYAISLDGSTINRVTPTNYDIELQYGRFDPQGQGLKVPANLTAGANNTLYIVQFEVQPLEEFRDAVRDAGGKIYHYMTNHCYIMELDASAKAEVQSLPFVRAVVPYHPAYRTDAGLRAKIANNTLPASHLYNITLIEEKNQQMMDDTVQLITMMGGEVTRAITANGFLTAKLNPSQFMQLLHLNTVSFADLWSPPGQDMDNLRAIHGVNYINTFGNFDGAGMNIAVMDGGFVQNHIAFLPRVLLWQTAVASNNHGTACLGINIGDGDGNAAGKGVLTAAGGVVATYNAYLSGGGDRNALTAQLLTSPYNALYQTNSWGDSQVTTYTTISAQMDSILFNNDIVILQSQSNLGTQSSRPQAWAKNMVSVGGAYHFDNQNWADDRWNNGASVGPAADGRIKPDLCNAYDAGLTTYTTTTTGYANFSGTSQATPMTAALFGVMYQVYAGGYYGNPCLGSSIFANRPKQQLAKAIMINTARMYDASNVDLSRFRQGWGTANLTNLWDWRNKMFLVNETDVLQNLQTKTYKLWVSPGTANFRATMSYLEPAGAVSPAISRKNNLSLKVTAPDGITIYWGNNGMTGFQNTTVAGGSENTLDTVENVYVANPASGVWTVEVIGSDINTDARVETPSVVDADFALAVSGVDYSLIPDTMTVQAGSLSSGGLADVARSENSYLVQGEPNDGETSDMSRFVIFETTAPSASLNNVGFVLEGRTGVPLGRAKVELFRYTTNTWVQVGDYSVAGTDIAHSFMSGTGGSVYIHPTTRRMRARVIYRDTDLGSDNSWFARTDLFRFQVMP